MTLEQAIYQVRTLCGTSASGGSFGVEPVKTMLNMAQRRVWRQLCERGPERFLVEETVVPTWTRDRFNYRDAGEGELFNAPPLSIFKVYLVVSGLGTVNEERVEVEYRDPGKMPESKGLYASLGPGYALGERDRYWTTVGQDFVMRPTPGATQSLVFLYLPDSVDMEETNDEIFGGNWPEFHDLVVLKAAVSLLLAVGDKSQGLLLMEQQAWEEANYLLKSQSAAPTSMVPYPR